MRNTALITAAFLITACAEEQSMLQAVESNYDNGGTTGGWQNEAPAEDTGTEPSEDEEPEETTDDTGTDEETEDDSGTETDSDDIQVCVCPHDTLSYMNVWWFNLDAWDDSHWFQGTPALEQENPSALSWYCGTLEDVQSGDELLVNGDAEGGAYDWLVWGDSDTDVLADIYLINLATGAQSDCDVEDNGANGGNWACTAP